MIDPNPEMNYSDSILIHYSVISHLADSLQFREKETSDRPVALNTLYYYTYTDINLLLMAVYVAANVDVKKWTAHPPVTSLCVHSFIQCRTQMKQNTIIIFLKMDTCVGNPTWHIVLQLLLKVKLSDGDSELTGLLTDDETGSDTKNLQQRAYL